VLIIMNTGWWKDDDMDILMILMILLYDMDMEIFYWNIK